MQKTVCYQLSLTASGDTYVMDITEISSGLRASSVKKMQIKKSCLTPVHLPVFASFPFIKMLIKDQKHWDSCENIMKCHNPMVYQYRRSW